MAQGRPPVGLHPTFHSLWLHRQVEALEKAAAAAKKTRSPRDVPDIVTMRKSDLERMVKVCAFLKVQGAIKAHI